MSSMESTCHTTDEDQKVPQRQYAPADSRLPTKTPLLGLGCSSFSTFFSSPEEESLTVDTISKDHIAVQGWVETIRHAVLNRGINLLDTAPWYGHGISEITVGYALDTLLTDDDEHDDDGGNSAPLNHLRRKRTGSLPRSRLIVNTKVGRYDANPLHQFDFSYDTTIQSIQRSLERMNCDYIDVIQLHDPEFAPSISLLKQETIPALVECKKRGWAKAIGLTGYPLEVQHQILVECQDLSGDGVVFDQSLVYCHNNLHDMSLYCDPCFPSLKDELEGQEDDGNITYTQFCQKSSIHLMAAAPLSMGLLTTAGPPPWHPAGHALKEGCAAAVKMCDFKGVNISSLALLYSLSQPEVGCTLLGMKDVREVDVAADLAIRFCGINFDVVGGNAGANNPFRRSNNDGILDKVLTQKEKEALALLMDENGGPFPKVKSNGEYRWNGKEEARKFWALVAELKKEGDLN
mmetsp:Transcript_5734/g.12497  ORF Transcript_5734/g.12497 Transcript_5734/m.12497 type:complete len:462 (+) Transcript_5734:84-1469(+)